MKKIAFLLGILLTGGITAMAQNTAPTDPTGKILEFRNASYQMGKIIFGKPVEYAVEIKNIGKDSIVLQSATAPCGCTTPNFVPNEKFGPDQTVKVTIHFSSNTMGPFTKFTTIYFSGGLSKQVSFTGEGVQEASTTQPPATSGTAGTGKTKVDKNL
ncbi:MAG: hypothetical protein NVS3B15_12240 [Sediminibacterium sp.]